MVINTDGKTGGHHVEMAPSLRSHDLPSSDKHAADDILQAQQLASQWQEGTQAEKDLVRKLDWRILPCCWVLYLLGFLDRANIGYVLWVSFVAQLW